jgi:hypothetical protein
MRKFEALSWRQDGPRHDGGTTALFTDGPGVDKGNRAEANEPEPSSKNEYRTTKTATAATDRTTKTATAATERTVSFF